MQKIKDAMANADHVDFSILLVHHHLFPVRALEDERFGKIRELTALAPLINSGSLLETLAAAHIAVALHGHEHAANWGRYATFEFGGGETNVIGAGSATGRSPLAEMQSWMLIAASFRRSTFHLIPNIIQII
jgi:hypothetical protein